MTTSQSLLYVIILIIDEYLNMELFQTSIPACGVLGVWDMELQY